MRKIFVVSCILLLFGSLTAFAGPTNVGPPTGPLLDLNGLPVTHGLNGAVTETVNFTGAASLTSTDITFAFRDDPAFVIISNVSVVDLTTPSGNLISNGNFALGTVGSSVATGWTYANIYGATFGGIVQTGDSCLGLTTCWYDGAVQAYDAISQNILTTSGDTYKISFDVVENGGLTTFQDLSTNGDVTTTGGNGVDVLVYAQSGLPPASNVPEPTSIMLLSTGLVGLAGALRRKLAVK